MSAAPIRMYGVSDFHVPAPEERKTLLLLPGEGQKIPLKTVSGEPTGKPGAESITSQPWFVPALVIVSFALVSLFSREPVGA